MTSEAAFVNTLEDSVCLRGAMDKFLTDSTRTEISDRVKDILSFLCNLIIDECHSKAGCGPTPELC